jgi:hypothetical protein
MTTALEGCSENATVEREYELAESSVPVNGGVINLVFT